MTLIKFIKKIFYYSLSLFLLFYASLLAKEWLIPWYLNAYDKEASWENMYEDNNNLLPNPVYNK